MVEHVDFKFKITLSKTLHGVRCEILSKQKNRKREIPGRYLRMATAQIPLPEKLDARRLKAMDRTLSMLSHCSGTC